MKHKKKAMKQQKLTIKCKMTKPLVCPEKCVINMLMTYKTGTTCPDLRFMKNTLL